MGAPTIRNHSALSLAPVTIPQPVVGNYIVVYNFGFNQNTTGVTDTAGNTYSHKLSASDANGNWVNLFTAPVTATGSGTNTITQTGGEVLWAAEITGQDPTNAIDGTITSGTFSGSAGGTLTAGAITTTVATDLILSGAIDQNSVTLTANTGTLVSGGVVKDYNIVQQHTTSAIGSYAEKFNVPVSSAETAVIIAIAIKGTASGTQSYSYTMAGGVTFGGAVVKNSVASRAASGGVVFSGSSAQLRRAARAAAGGITFAGSAQELRKAAITPSGGLSLGGTAPRSFALKFQASGGLAFSGSAQESSSGLQRYSYTGSGGISLSGAAAYTNSSSGRDATAVSWYPLDASIGGAHLFFTAHSGVLH